MIDLETGEVEATYDIPIDFFPPVIAGTRAGLLLAGGHRDDVEAIDIATGEVRLRLPGHAPGATAIAVSEPAGLILTAIDIDGQPALVQLWRLADGVPMGTMEIPGGRHVDALAFSRDGGRFAVSTGGTALVYTSGERTKVGEIAFHPIFSGFDLAFTADGKGLITCQSHPILWDIETGKLERHFGPFSDLCHSLDVSPDGRFVVATSMGSDLRVWEIESGAFHRRLGTNVTTQP